MTYQPTEILSYLFWHLWFIMGAVWPTLLLVIMAVSIEDLRQLLPISNKSRMFFSVITHVLSIVAVAWQIYWVWKGWPL